jgi:hypothetical protein
MATFEVPLSPQAQTFDITLGGVAYKLTLMWREADGGGWFLDFADTAGQPILSGVPLVTGADLLEQYAYLGFTGWLVVQTDHDTDALPTFENLGERSHLYFVTR